MPKRPMTAQILRLPLPILFHQENTLATREGGPTSNQRLWELGLFSALRRNWSTLGKSHVTEDWVCGRENANSSPGLETLPKEVSQWS